MEVRINDNSVEISGYVNAVERYSRVLHDRDGAFIEKVSAGCFAKALRDADTVGLYFNHVRQVDDTDGNLILEEDNIGLRAECVVTDDEIVTAAREDRLSGWSFGFVPVKDSWETNADNMRCRTLDEIRLIEVSVLTATPAYIGTSISTRSGEVTEYAYNDNIEVRKIVEDIPVVESEQEEEPQETPVERSYDAYIALANLYGKD